MMAKVVQEHDANNADYDREMPQLYECAQGVGAAQAKGQAVCRGQ